MMETVILMDHIFGIVVSMQLLRIYHVCMLPGISLTTGQWVRVADPDDPVDCNSNNASDPFRCTSVTSPNATINLYLAQGLPADQEGWYKCCLPTDCSDPNTNIIFANIFSKRRL